MKGQTLSSRLGTCSILSCGQGLWTGHRPGPARVRLIKPQPLALMKTEDVSPQQDTTDSALSVSLCAYDSIIWTRRFHPHGQAYPKAALSVDGTVLSTGTDGLSVCPEWSLASYHIVSSGSSVPRGHHSDSCDWVHGHL